MVVLAKGILNLLDEPSSTFYTLASDDGYVFGVDGTSYISHGIFHNIGGI
jgi:hypothetical protein